MDWMLLLVAALAALIAAIVAFFMSGSRDEEEGRPFAGTFFIAWVVLFAVAHFTVYPSLNAWYQIGQVEKTLKTNAAFQAIKRYEPVAYEKIIADIKRELDNKSDKSKLTAVVRQNIVTLVSKKISQASNEATVAYIQVMMQEMDELRQKGGTQCYSFMFPEPGVAQDLTQLISPATTRADLAALAKVIQSAAEHPQVPPSESEVRPLMTPVFMSLANEYGDKIRFLQNPRTPGVDKAAVCGMASRVYSKILELPEQDSGRVLRYMLSHV